MIFSSILAPIDGSAPSNAAIALAIKLAKENGAALAFYHVAQVPLPAHDAGGFARDQIQDEERTRAHEILGSASAAASAAGISATTAAVGGPVVDAILDAAKERRADVIVMGTHGRGGIARAILGSKTADVIRRAEVPVLVAPHAA